MISNQLRTAILESGMSYNAIHHKTGIAIGSLTRFMVGKTGLSIDNVNILCQLFNLRLGRYKPRHRSGVDRLYDVKESIPQCRDNRHKFRKVGESA